MTATPVRGAAAAPSINLRRLLLRDREQLPDRLAELVAATDGVAFVRAGPLRFAVVADPALAWRLLTLPTGVRKGRGIDAIRILLGDGLLTSEGALHHRQRRLIQPVFHPARLARYAEDVVRLGRAASQRWHDGQQVDLAQEMSALTFEVVGRTLFGADVRAESAEVSRALADLLAAFPSIMRPGGALLLRYPTPLRHRMRATAARLDAVIARLVARRRAELDAGAAPSTDVLTLLLLARDEETGEAMSERLVRDEALTLLLAGHETTAVALAWTWFELSRHPEGRALLDAELGSAAGREALDVAAWERLPVTRAVVAESMRLHPPAFVIGRRVVDPLELGGHALAPGTLCLVSPYALQRDPRSWPDEAAWRPQRWLDAAGTFDESAPGQPRGAFLPFGAGARICIGATFAWMEATLLLGVLASGWRADVPPGFEPGHEPAVTLRPKRGVPARLTALASPRE